MSMPGTMKQRRPVNVAGIMKMRDQPFRIHRNPQVVDFDPALAAAHHTGQQNRKTGPTGLPVTDEGSEHGRKIAGTDVLDALFRRPALHHGPGV